MPRYISKEFYHFVGRGLQQDEQYVMLAKILKGGLLMPYPHNPHMVGNVLIFGGQKLSTNTKYAPQVVCFCDIPREDLDAHMIKYSRFGLGFHKSFLLRHGAAPVFYVPRDSYVPLLSFLRGHTRWDDIPNLEIDGVEAIRRSDLWDALEPELCDSLEKTERAFREEEDERRASGLATDTDLAHPMKSDSVEDVIHFVAREILCFVKFFDGANDDNDYLEREWRLVGQLKFGASAVTTILLPKSFAQRFRSEFPQHAGQLLFTDG